MQGSKNSRTKKATQNTETVFKWTPETILKAQQEHYYAKVNHETSKQLLITGAIGRWNKEDSVNDVYSPKYRLVGDSKAIREVLLSNHFNQREVDEELANGVYNRDNFNTKNKDAFEKEIADYKEYKKNHKKQTEQTSVNLDTLNNVVSLLPQPYSSLPPKKRLNAQRDQHVKDKFNEINLEEGYFMDVSSMKIDGSGIKKRSASAPSNTKFGDTDSIGIISSDIKNYELALRSLDYSDESIAQLLERFKEQEKNESKQQVKVKKPPKKVSPKKETAKKQSAKKPVALKKTVPAKKAVPVKKQVPLKKNTNKKPVELKKVTKADETPATATAPANASVITPATASISSTVSVPVVTERVVVTPVQPPVTLPVVTPAVVEKVTITTTPPQQTVSQTVAAKAKSNLINKGKVSRRSPR